MIDMLDCKDHYTRVLIHKLGRFCEKAIREMTHIILLGKGILNRHHQASSSGQQEVLMVIDVLMEYFLLLGFLVPRHS